MDPTFPHSLEFVPMLSGNGADKTTNVSLFFPAPRDTLPILSSLCRVSTNKSPVARQRLPLSRWQPPPLLQRARRLRLGPILHPSRRCNPLPSIHDAIAKRASPGAPAVTNGPNGLPWLRQFLSLCTGCKIDLCLSIGMMLPIMRRTFIGI